MNLSDFSSWFLMLCYTQGHCSGQPSSQPAWTLAMASLKCPQPHASSFQQETQPSRSPHSTQTPTSSIVPLDLWTCCFHHQEHLPIHPPSLQPYGRGWRHPLIRMLALAPQAECRTAPRAPAAPSTPLSWNPTVHPAAAAYLPAASSIFPKGRSMSVRF